MTKGSEGPHFTSLHHIVSCDVDERLARNMARSSWRYGLLFLSFLCFALAACMSPSHRAHTTTGSLTRCKAPTSFCKCTCNTNSTIIPLDGPASSIPPTGSSNKDSPPSRHKSSLLHIRAEFDAPPAKHRRSCADCTKSFCLEYQLPICKDVELDNVFTTCFQRDSTKDELVVFIFLGATVGLLGWAGVRPWFERWREGRRYGIVASGGT